MSPHRKVLQRELRALLEKEAVIPPGAGQPLLQPDGRPGAFLFYPWTVLMSGHGLDLAAACLLDVLRGFRGTQLATFGSGGLPLLSACVALGQNRYSGLLVREERKRYGSVRRIDGPADRDQPVVVVDDTFGSGASVFTATEALEREGFLVEGAATLVHFPGFGGKERLEALGYLYKSVFEVGLDLRLPVVDEQPEWQALVPITWSEPRIESGLHPAMVARHTAVRFLSTGEVPRPPDRLDGDYDGRGGVFVSFRERHSSARIHRDGFWHFNPGDANPARDTVLATVKTLRDSPVPFKLEWLAGLKIGVTLCGPLRKAVPRDLDFTSLGLVVVSSDLSRVGGALPNTQCFLSEIEQYRHARVTNAGIGALEAHDIYVHSVTKCIEPGEYWLPFGSPADPVTDWTRDDDLGARLLERACGLVEEMAAGCPPSGQALPAGLVPAPVFGIGVTLYSRGAASCTVSWDGTLDDCLRHAVGGALEQGGGAADGVRLDPADVAVSVSILHDREWLGAARASEVAAKVRPGLDSLLVCHGDRHAVFLPSVPVYFNWPRRTLVSALLDKAAITAPPYRWVTCPTATWLRWHGRDRRLMFGFPDRTGEDYGPTAWEADIRLLASYVLRHVAADGLPEYSYAPVTGARAESGDAARRVHALGVLGRAGRELGVREWQEAAAAGLGRCVQYLRPLDGGAATLVLPRTEPDAMADCQLLLALAAALGRVPGATEGLVARCRSLIRRDGRITAQPDARGLEQDHDYLPGAVLLALAATLAPPVESLRALDLGRTFEWYRRRFVLAHPWGMVGWHTQAWAALSRATGQPAYAEFVFAMADWAMDWQHRRTGAFLAEAGGEGLSFFTAFLAEGIADAWALALERGDGRRAETYRQSCHDALKFADRLILREEDVFCAPHPGLALGGVRGSLASSEVRIDFVSHTLTALLKCRAAEVAHSTASRDGSARLR